MRVTTTTRIACPPENVFDTLADLRNDKEWNSRVTSAELRSPEPIGLGSRFAIVNGGTAYDVTITGYDRPSRLVFEASGKPDLTIACTLTSTGEGTELESDFDFRPRGALKVVFALLASDPPRRAQAVRLVQGALRALNARSTRLGSGTGSRRSLAGDVPVCGRITNGLFGVQFAEQSLPFALLQEARRPKRGRLLLKDCPRAEDSRRV